MESNGLPISIRTSPANQHDSTKFIDVLENISDFLNDDLIHAIVSARCSIHQKLFEMLWN